MKKFFKNNQGAAIIEFAIIVPVLLVLFLMSIEFTRYFIINQKVERSTYVMANLVSQYQPATTPYKTGQISTVEITKNIMTQYATVMAQDDTQSKLVVFSSFSKINGKTVMNWQYSVSGTNSLSGPVSIITSKSPTTQLSYGGQAVLPNQAISQQVASMYEGENAVLVEVFYQYSPILQPQLQAFSGTFLSKKLISTAIFAHPRQGALDTLPVM